MNPLDYTFYTLNAKCYLIEPNVVHVVGVSRKSYRWPYVFFFGFVVGLWLPL